MHRRRQAVGHHGHHSGVEVRVGQTFLLEQHPQRLLQRFAPAEGQLEGFLTVQVAGRKGGVLGARLSHALVSPEVVPCGDKRRAGKK